MSLPEITADLFDFSNTTDLPEELQSGINTDKAEKINKVVAILDNAPRPLTISEVQAVYFRAYKEQPAQTTLRSHLNAAVTEGKACKPSRQFYAAAGTVVMEEAPLEEAPEANAEIEVNTEGSDDLLGDLAI